RRGAAAEGARDGRTAGPARGRKGRQRRRADRQAQERSGRALTILLLADHDNASLKDATPRALTAAGSLGGDVHLLIAGNKAAAAAGEAAKLAGVAKVLLAEADDLEHQLAEPLAALVVSLAGGYEVLAAPASTSGKNVMPRVAALLDVMQVSDVTKVIA